MYNPNKKYNKYLLRCDKCGNSVVYDEDKYARRKADLQDEMQELDQKLKWHSIPENKRYRLHMLIQLKLPL